MPFKNPHPLYQTWANMRGRCRNPTDAQWANYGGRGISICRRWDSFHQFVADMGDKPPGHTLDRIDVNGNYEPDNCRWASRRTQNLNKRNTQFVVVDGLRHRAHDLAQVTGLKVDTIVFRAALGLSFAEVVQPGKRRDLSGLSLGGLANGARQRSRTHCKRGHEFTPENTYLSKDGCRHCRECHNAKMRCRNAEKRASQ